MVTFGVSLRAPYQRLGALAREAEDRGLDAVWVAENAFESTLQAAVCVGATARLQVGTNITLAFPRSPTITAMQAWDLCDLSEDRFVMGLGSQVRRIVEERFSAEFAHPARRMAEYVRAMRTVWRIEQGEDVTFQGEFYRVLRPGIAGPGRSTDRRTPRVFVAALGPLMVQAAAEHADGMLGHPFTSPRFIAEVVVPKVESSLREAGRRREDFTVAQGLIVSVDDDRKAARRAARQQIAFYGTTPNYREVFEVNGDGHLTDVLRAAWPAASQEPAALADLVPDEVVERYAVAGTPDEVREQIQAFAQHVDHVILGSPWFGVGTSRLAENTAAIMETFGRAIAP